ncbi:PLP-dependent aminotransferase family protein [Bosea sp. 685]|uniref:MocR-like pyridoxine biosynthesis transcription factor PdxR n=1 Tax=Bosea sp. 685 TaxID=3080057 RepID=UPI0028937467|nr:PLP-dependent aminotransferase family protein [Bosea sp. 685]WNJ87879.1 PLP-dependent aminotransferase family protein [Bosea sp. 685]
MSQFVDVVAAGTQRMRAREIYQALKDQILGGVFGKQGQLPSSRTLAVELGVSRTTVTVVYEQLLAEGFIEVRQGSRPRVALAAVAPLRPAMQSNRASPKRPSDFAKRIANFAPWLDTRGGRLIADFRYGDLAPADFPIGVWKRAVNSAMAATPERLAYDDPRGSRRLRTALQGYLWRARTLRCDLEQIIVVAGSQQGLDLCARLLLNPDDRFAIENPCYAMARQIFSSTGASPIPINADRDGLNVGALTDFDARLAYVTPSHQFPLGGVMSVSRRYQLLEWARRHEAYVIEDDYDSEYRYDIKPVPPLYGLQEGSNVIYLGTISKTLSPMLRIGYLVVPPELQNLFATAKQLTDRHTPVTEQDALATLIEAGAYESHVRRVRRSNGERRQTLLNALRLKFGDAIEIEGADAGLHIVVWFRTLPARMEGTLVNNARQARIGIHSIASLYDPKSPEAHPDRLGLVMGYAALDLKSIERGVQILGDVVAETLQVTQA